MDNNNRHIEAMYDFLTSIIEGKPITEQAEEATTLTYPTLEQRLKATSILISKLDVFKNLNNKTEKSQYVKKLRKTLQTKLDKITKTKRTKKAN